MSGAPTMGQDGANSGAPAGGMPHSQQVDHSMNPMAMLQAYRQGQSLPQVSAMNQPTARPAQYLPPAMAQYTPPPAPMQQAGLMGGGPMGNPNGNYMTPDDQWMRNYDAGGGGS